MTITWNDIGNLIRSLGQVRPSEIVLLDIRKVWTPMGNKLRAKFAVPAIPEGYVTNREVVASRFGVKINGGEESFSELSVGTPFFTVDFDPPAALDLTLVLVDDQGNLSENPRTAHYELNDTVKPPDAGDIALDYLEEVPE